MNFDNQLDGSQKEGVTFLTCFRKWGFPQKRGGVPTLEETMPLDNNSHKLSGIRAKLSAVEDWCPNKVLLKNR